MRGSTEGVAISRAICLAEAIIEKSTGAEGNSSVCYITFCQELELHVEGLVAQLRGIGLDGDASRIDLLWSRLSDTYRQMRDKPLDDYLPVQLPTPSQAEPPSPSLAINTIYDEIEFIEWHVFQLRQVVSEVVHVLSQLTIKGSIRNGSVRSRGRPRTTNHKEDLRILEAWKTGRHKTYSDFAIELGGDLTADDVKRTIDRVKKRQKKAAE